MKLESGLEVKMLVAGVALQEYEGEAEETEVAATPTLTRYVEAVPGSKFEIQFLAQTRFTAPAPNDSVCCRVYLDGKYATGSVLDANFFARAACTFIIPGVQTHTSRGPELQRFLFAQLNTSDDPTAATQAKPKDFKSLGLITTKFTWCRQNGTNIPVLKDSFKPAIGTSVPEKCLKGRAISQHAE